MWRVDEQTEVARVLGVVVTVEVIGRFCFFFGGGVVSGTRAVSPEVSEGIEKKTVYEICGSGRHECHPSQKLLLCAAKHPAARTGSPERQTNRPRTTCLAWSVRVSECERRNSKIRPSQMPRLKSPSTVRVLPEALNPKKCSFVSVGRQILGSVSLQPTMHQ